MFPRSLSLKFLALLALAIAAIFVVRISQQPVSEDIAETIKPVEQRISSSRKSPSVSSISHRERDLQQRLGNTNEMESAGKPTSPRRSPRNANSLTPASTEIAFNSRDRDHPRISTTESALPVAETEIAVVENLESINEELDIPTDPGQPGNHFIAQNYAITVQAYQPTQEGPSLAISIESSPRQTETGASATNSSFSDQPVSTNDRPVSSSPTGLTYEEQLFRTKWGWAAYAEVQKEAARQSSNNP